MTYLFFFYGSSLDFSSKHQFLKVHVFKKASNILRNLSSLFEVSEIGSSVKAQLGYFVKCFGLSWTWILWYLRERLLKLFHTVASAVFWIRASFHFGRRDFTFVQFCLENREQKIYLIIPAPFFTLQKTPSLAGTPEAGRGVPEESCSLHPRFFGHRKENRAEIKNLLFVAPQIFGPSAASAPSLVILRRFITYFKRAGEVDMWPDKFFFKAKLLPNSPWKSWWLLVFLNRYAFTV